MDSSTPTPTESEAPQTEEYFKLLISVIALTIAADFFLFGNGPGLGTSIFCVLVWIGLRLNRPSAEIERKDWLLFGLMAASAIQTTIEPSLSNWLVLFALTVYASGHFLHRELSPYWRRALEGLLGLIHIPLAFSNLRSGFQAGKESTQSSTFSGAVDQSRRWIKIILPAVILTTLFLILFSRGNAIMGDGISSTMGQIGEWFARIEFPSFGRMVFWMGIGLVLFALMGRAPLSPVVQWVSDFLPEKSEESTDLSARVWQTRIALIAVNVIFFASNSVDFIYLWMDTELPDDINFSEFVHQGVNNLIICVILAAVVLLITFQQDKEITHAKGQRTFAYIWIGQNFLLISSVLLRLNLYVDAYHLSVSRLHVGYFLVIVAIGFILLAIKISHERKFVWLIHSNLLVVFFLFFLIQFFNEKGFVARFNCDQIVAPGNSSKVLDIAYLDSLGPAAWPYLRRVADDSEAYGIPASVVRSYLKAATADEIERLDSGNWKSWQFRRWVSRAALPGFENE